MYAGTWLGSYAGSWLGDGAETPITENIGGGIVTLPSRKQRRNRVVIYDFRREQERVDDAVQNFDQAAAEAVALVRDEKPKQAAKKVIEAAQELYDAGDIVAESMAWEPFAQSVAAAASYEGPTAAAMAAYMEIQARLERLRIEIQDEEEAIAVLLLS